MLMLSEGVICVISLKDAYSVIFKIPAIRKKSKIILS